MIIGICGKSGSGKSTLSNLIKEFSNNECVHLDIDKVGHEALLFPEVMKELIKSFGKDVVKANMVDRKKLGEIVFNSRHEMDKLTAITWKYMRVEIDKFIKENKNKTIILDWLLLPLSSEHFNMCDIRVLLDIPYEVRKERAMRRDNIEEEAFDLREKNSIDFNRNEFNFVIDENEDINKVVSSIVQLEKVERAIASFIDRMGYLENEHVLGCFFYGSYLTGYSNKNSDVDLHIIFDNSNPKHLIRGNEYINEFRIEYFEKPINDLYLSADNDFNNQCNALLSIVGTSKIVFDKGEYLKQLREYVLEKFSKPLPPLEKETAKEYVSIINNRMEKLEKAVNDNSPYFYHLYHLTIEKIRKFYHKLNGLPEVPTSKVFRVYTDEDYRKSFYKDDIPEEEFIIMYLDAISDNDLDMKNKLKKVQDLYNYAKRDVSLEEDSYRILIKSRNK